MADERTSIPPVPESRAVARKRTRISVVWVIPIIAAVVGAWVAISRIESEGPKIEIIFGSAEGLEAGKTRIEYKGVEVGTITAIRLTEDHQRVIATAQMTPRTEQFLVEDTEFWVVRPRISGANVSGLGTLISGAYIGVEIGVSKEPKSEFVALETPPVVTGGAAGRFFVLRSPDLGSLDTGTPVFFRRLQVGQVASYVLNKDGQRFDVKIFVRAPYDQYVNPNTRFWQASRIDMQLSANGLSVQTQSLLSILIGGIAFETPASAAVLPAAAANASFDLFDTRAQAFQPAARNPQTYELIFNESVRGLEPGAPVEFRGIPVGEVADVRAQIDVKTFEFSVPVTIRLDPQRLGIKIIDTSSGVNLETIRRKFIDSLVSHGVRAQLRTGNLLTGAVYVAFDIFPGSPSTTVDWSQKPVRLPTVPGQLQATEATVENVIKKIDQMPLQRIGDNLAKSLGDLDLTLVTARGTLASAQGTLVSAQGTLTNTGNLTGPNSAQLQQLDATLREVSRAVRSVRVLADYLERHPEALIRGKQGGPK
jgi:paraquat-inducible protein B